jgi:hypothetical protein
MKQGANNMAKQPLQEIYGDPNNNEILSDDSETAKALGEIINELRELYGNEWPKHLDSIKKGMINDN